MPKSTLNTSILTKIAWTRTSTLPSLCKRVESLNARFPKESPLAVTPTDHVPLRHSTGPEPKGTLALRRGIVIRVRELTLVLRNSSLLAREGEKQRKKRAILFCRGEVSLLPISSERATEPEAVILDSSFPLKETQRNCRDWTPTYENPFQDFCPIFTMLIHRN